MKHTDDYRDQELDLILFAGQSNMSGRGEAASAVTCDAAAGYEYKAVTNPGGLVPVREPFGLGEDREGGIWDYDSDGRSKRTGSMVSAAVQAYYSRTGRRIVGVSASVGGSDTVQWKQTYVADAVERLDRAKAFLTESGCRVKEIFVVWCQGESDGDARRSAEDYAANSREIFGQFKAHGARVCFLVQTGHYNYVDFPGITDGLTGRQWDMHYETIRSAQARLCRTDDDFVLAGSFEPCLHQMKDRYHYNQEAYNMVGNKVGTIMADYVTENLPSCR